MRHYGQHTVCAKCDAIAKSNAFADSEEGKAYFAERAAKSQAARKLATELNLPQSIIDRAACYAVDDRWSLTVEEAIEKAIIADPAYIPTISQALRHPDAFVDGMTSD